MLPSPPLEASRGRLSASYRLEWNNKPTQYVYYFYQVYQFMLSILYLFVIVFFIVFCFYLSLF